MVYSPTAGMATLRHVIRGVAAAVSCASKAAFVRIVRQELSCALCQGNARMYVTAKRKDRRRAKEKTRKATRKGGEHLDRRPHEGDKLKLT